VVLSQDSRPQGSSRLAVTSSMIVTAASTEPSPSTHCSRLQQRPALLPVTRLTQCRSSGSGLLGHAAGRTREDRPWSISCPSAFHLFIVTHPALAGPRPAVLYRSEPKAIQCSLIGVDEAIVVSADRHRLTERVEYRSQTPVTAVSLPSRIHQWIIPTPRCRRAP